MICSINNSMYVQSFYVQRLYIFINIKNILDIWLCNIIVFTSSLVLSLKDRDLETWFEVPACDAVPRVHVASWCPKSSSTERTSIWYCCCRTASVQMLGFPRTFSSGMGFQKKLRTLRFFLVLVDKVDGGGGGGGGALGGRGGRGGGGGAEILELLAASSMVWVCPDIEDRSEALVMEEEAVQLPPSLLQLSGSLIVDGQLITSIPRRSSQHRIDADVKKKTWSNECFWTYSKAQVKVLHPGEH